MGSTLSLSQERAKAGSALVARSVGQAGSKPILSPRMRVTLSNTVEDTMTLLTPLVEKCLCSLIDECTTIPSAPGAWTSCRAGHTERERLRLIEARHISVSATLWNGSQGNALSLRPSKEARNSRKVSKDNEKTKFTTLALCPHHLACYSRVMYRHT